jgi:uncharacterized protein with GYD domain
LYLDARPVVRQEADDHTCKGQSGGQDSANAKGGRYTSTYVVLANFTDQGIRNIKEARTRRQDTRELIEKVGAKVRDGFLTMGRYDLVLLVEAPNDSVMSTVLYSLGARGNLRTETLRAFTPQEADEAMAKIV